ncbi:MAG: hypothetical protein KF678_02055 [Phycisphaeraceae bacterium]|nr:hypothetical protein [Phycisphaeraceae bacterium]
MWIEAVVAALVAQPVPVEPGKEDVNPHALTMRRIELDLRKPVDFDNLYQISKADAFGRGQRLFMRIDGGVTAVFPRSVYSGAVSGGVPEIPPGTVFWIGVPPVEVETLPPMPGDTFLHLSVANDPPVQPTSTVTVNSIVTDEAYRQRRVAALLERACRAR